MKIRHVCSLTEEAFLRIPRLVNFTLVKQNGIVPSQELICGFRLASYILEIEQEVIQNLFILIAATGVTTTRSPIRELI